MKQILSLILIVIAIGPGHDLSSQVLIRNSRITGTCYAGNKVHRIYIPPRMKRVPRNGSKGGGTITVNYTGFTSQAKSAVEFAAGIIEDMLPSDLRITLNATWTSISSSGVLGNSSVTSFAGGWNINALKPNAYYPVTVAEKIAGRSLNED